MTIEVYHGTIMSIRHPDVAKGRDNLDFGKGFYVTRLKEQAIRWAHVIYSRYEGHMPVVNTYKLDLEAIVTSDTYKHKTFSTYDKEWLDFIVDSRMGRKPWREYDMIEGGVANDRVIDTIEGYMNGDFSAEVAIGRLKHYKPNNQIAILNQEIVDKFLSWVCAETLKV